MGIIILIVLVVAFAEFCGVFRSIIEQIKVEMGEQNGRRYTPTEYQNTPEVVQRPKPTINLNIEDTSKKEIEKSPDKPKPTINLFIEQ